MQLPGEWSDTQRTTTNVRTVSAALILSRMMQKWFTLVWYDKDEMDVVDQGMFGPFDSDATREMTIKAVFEDLAEDEAGDGLVLGTVRFDVEGQSEPTLREGEGLLGFRKWASW